MRLLLTAAMMLLIAAPAWGQAGAAGLPPGLTPGPGQAARQAVQHQIEAIEAGQPDYSAMTPNTAATFRSSIEPVQAGLGAWGGFEFLDFGRLLSGSYVFVALFDKAQVAWAINPLDADGKITALAFKTLSFSSAADHQGPSPGTEASLRRYIESLEKGEPNYQEMMPGLARAVRQQLPSTMEFIRQSGALKSISFLAVEPNGFNEYGVVFEHSQAIWWLAPLTPDGRVSGRFFQKVQTDVSCCHVGSGP